MALKDFLKCLQTQEASTMWTYKFLCFSASIVSVKYKSIFVKTFHKHWTHRWLSFPETIVTFPSVALRVIINLIQQ